VTRVPAAAESPGIQHAVRETFLKAAGPLLVKRIVEILEPRGIPVMPLKGVLLQKLVYGDKAFRPIVDVDVLVPEERFFEAWRLLRANGFTGEQWEIGRWQVTLRNPDGPPLGIDLHRRLTRTVRSRLTEAELFARGRPDSGMFGAPVILPSPDDLFAHLLLHATLHWLRVSRLHRPGDFQAAADALGLDAVRCAAHLASVGLTAHARLMLPMVAEETTSPFVEHLLTRLEPAVRGYAAAWLAGALAARSPPGRPGRRLANLALAPSLSAALFAAARDRLGRYRES